MKIFSKSLIIKAIKKQMIIYQYFNNLYLYIIYNECNYSKRDLKYS